MATNYTASAKVKCWKEHECSACGTRYRYLFVRTKRATAASEREAALKANDAVVKALKKQVETRPCPRCGLVQPDMVGSRQFAWHGGIALATLVLLAIAIVVSIPAKLPLFLWISAAAAIGIMIAHIVVAFRPFNSNYEANRDRSAERIEDGTLQVVRKGRRDTDDEERAEPLRQFTPIWCFAVMFVGILMMPSAEVVRQLNGWIWNDAWTPAVAGPGDRTCVYFPQSIGSIKNHWRGQAQARVVNFAELGLADLPLPCESSNDDWGTSISVKNNETNSNSTPWMYVFMPDVPEPQGKKVRLALHLDVTFPVAMGNNAFQNNGAALDHQAEIVLSAAGSQGKFLLAWRLGSLLGLMIVAAMGGFLVLRANSLYGRALPTRVSPFDNADEEARPEDLVPPITEGRGLDSEEAHLRELSLQKLIAKRQRTRIWFIVMAIMIPASIILCYSSISLFDVPPDKSAFGTVLAVTGCVGPLICIIGVILLGVDGFRQDRIIKQKTSELDLDEPRSRRRRRRDDEEDDRPRRPRRREREEDDRDDDRPRRPRRGDDDRFTTDDGHRDRSRYARDEDYSDDDPPPRRRRRRDDDD